MASQPIDPAELLDLAEELASLSKHPGRTSHLRRAVSTAYYALFHELAAEVVMVTLQTEYWDDITPLRTEDLVTTARDAVDRAQQLLADDDPDHRRFLALGLGAVRIAKDRG